MKKQTFIYSRPGQAPTFPPDVVIIGQRGCHNNPANRRLHRLVKTEIPDYELIPKQDKRRRAAFRTRFASRHLHNFRFHIIEWEEVQTPVGPTLVAMGSKEATKKAINRKISQVFLDASKSFKKEQDSINRSIIDDLFEDLENDGNLDPFLGLFPNELVEDKIALPPANKSNDAEDNFEGLAVDGDPVFDRDVCYKEETASEHNIQEKYPVGEELECATLSPDKNTNSEEGYLGLFLDDQSIKDEPSTGQPPSAVARMPSPEPAPPESQEMDQKWRNAVALQGFLLKNAANMKGEENFKDDNEG